MEKVGDMVLYTDAEIRDEIIGKVGTPRRDDFEAKLEADLFRARLGNRIREIRKDLNLTQSELGERVGVKCAQISKIESGRNITIDVLIRIVKGLGVPVEMDWHKYGVVALI